MIERITHVLATRMRWVLLATVIGAVTFLIVQHTLSKGSQDIVAYLGKQIVARGGYDAHLIGVIGWSVHIFVSLGYALIYCLLCYLPAPRMADAARVAYGAAAAALLGWLTTLITSPAISLTISLFAGKGIPKNLPPLNTSGGLPLWNHVAFFTICYILIVFIPMLLHSQAQARMHQTASTAGG